TTTALMSEIAAALFPFNPVAQIIVGDVLRAIFASNTTAPSGTEFEITIYDDNSVDYSLSPNPVFIDLTTNPEHGAPFAEGDNLINILEVTGTSHDDVLRGSDALGGAVVNDPGENVLNGLAGNDLLEGRGGADTLNGGLGFDIASYESSP